MLPQRKTVSEPTYYWCIEDLIATNYKHSWIEAAGGALLAAGLFTRAVAFFASGEMAIAYWMVHAPKSFYPVINGGDLASLFCFVFLLFVFAGPAPGAHRSLRNELMTSN